MSNQRRYEDYNQVEWSSIPFIGTKIFKPVCNTIIFVNQGTTTAWLDNMIRILPNQSFTFEHYPGEITTHSFQISFTGIGENELIAVTKNYPL